MPMSYQNNMYHQMPYVQQQYGVNSYIPYMQPRFQQQEVQVPQQPPQAQQMPGGLNGMVVQTIENVTADCVPMDGSAAFFPKQDLSEIYVKSWCADGTIRTLVFKPVEITGNTNKNDSGLPENATAIFEKRFDELFGKIEQLEQTITNSMAKKPVSATKKAGEA